VSSMCRPVRGSSRSTGCALKAWDFDDDRKNDIAVFTRGTVGNIYVAFSDDAKFVGSAQKWQEYLAANDELPEPATSTVTVKPDIITYTRGTVEPCTSPSPPIRTSAGARHWHGNFAFSPEVPVPRAIVIQ
jgi:hypothetical protein